jgi:hypothetical protein
MPYVRETTIEQVGYIERESLAEVKLLDQRGINDCEMFVKTQGVACFLSSLHFGNIGR